MSVNVDHRWPIVAATTLLASALLGGAATAQQRPFTVDVMVQAEGVAEAVFEPHGRRLLVEKTAAYQSSQNFAWDSAWSRERAALMNVDMSGDHVLQALSPDKNEHIWLGSYSPSGNKVAIGWFDGDESKSGVYDFKTKTLHKFDFLISHQICAFDCPYWVSDEEFIHFTLSADTQKMWMSPIVYTDDLASRWAHDTWKGKQAAVKVLGSGRYQSQAVQEGGRLIKVNANTGQQTILGEGLYSQIEMAPDRKHLATLRETGSLNLVGTELKGIVGEDRVFELAIYDFNQNGLKVLPCPACNPRLSSLVWSPGGSKLFFDARTVKDGKQVYEHYVYDLHRAKLTRFSPQGLNFQTEEDIWSGNYVTPFAWMSEDIPAVRITTRRPGTFSNEAHANKEDLRYDWYALLRGSKALKLTDGFNPTQDRKRLEDYVAARDGNLFISVDGQLWQLSARGERKNLTQSVGAPVAPWCSVIAYWRELGYRPICSGLRTNSGIRSIDQEAFDRGWITLITLKDIRDKVSTGDVVFLNIKTGETERIRHPSADAELITASALAKAALYRRKGDDGDRLLLARSDGHTDELLHFNRQLAGVVGGQPVMITRREGQEEEDRIDWLLLPPGHQDGDRHPLLVYFYPDTEYSKEWRSDDLRAVSFLNHHLPASRGYAVLLASMKISTTEQRGDPMLEMHEQLIHAAENVVSLGYADATRWAIMGHSYGGYGTNCVVSQTNRFKAAVALDGVTNLTSGYATGLSAEKAIGIAAGLSFGASWSEGGQGRMGVAPWQNPQRYIRNSPLFSADKITTPLMLMHGDDDFVDINEAEQMFNALHRQGKDAELVRYWGEGHIYTSPANIRDMWQRILAWFDDHLDVARDEHGNVLFVDHRVKGRNGAPALKPEDFAHFDQMTRVPDRQTSEGPIRQLSEFQ